MNTLQQHRTWDRYRAGLARHALAAGRVIVAPIGLTRLPADIGFVHFDEAGQQLAVIGERLTDAVHHRPYRGAAHVEIARRLHRGEAFLGREHQRDQQEPALQIDMRVVEDGSDRDAERAHAALAFPALGRGLARGVAVVRDARSAAVGTERAVRPADLFQMRDAILARRPTLIDFDDAGHCSRPAKYGRVKPSGTGEQNGIVRCLPASPDFPPIVTAVQYLKKIGVRQILHRDSERKRFFDRIGMGERLPGDGAESDVTKVGGRAVGVIRHRRPLPIDLRAERFCRGRQRSVKLRSGAGRREVDRWRSGGNGGGTRPFSSPLFGLAGFAGGFQFFVGHFHSLPLVARGAAGEDRPPMTSNIRGLNLDVNP